MKHFILYIILLSLCFPKLKGQADPTDTQEVLGKLFDRLVDNYNDTSRINIDDSIRTIVDRYVRSDSVFSYKFDNLRHLGQITSPDSLLKIVTWNLVLSNHPGRYYCYFVFKGDSGKANRVYSLATTYREQSVKTDTTYTESDWYGALYYDLKPYVIDNQRCWVLLGIDYGNARISRKIIDVLSLAPDSSLIFGKKWFESGGKLRFRDVFEYAANATMTLRFTSARSIVFDHLVPFNSSQADDREFYGPDYSTDAYNFENGIWKFSLNVEARNRQ